MARKTNFQLIASIQDRLKASMSWADIVKELGVSNSTISRAKKMMEQDSTIQAKTRDSSQEQAKPLFGSKKQSSQQIAHKNIERRYKYLKSLPYVTANICIHTSALSKFQGQAKVRFDYHGIEINVPSACMHFDYDDITEISIKENNIWKTLYEAESKITEHPDIIIKNLENTIERLERQQTEFRKEIRNLKQDLDEAEKEKYELKKDLEEAKIGQSVAEFESKSFNEVIDNIDMQNYVTRTHYENTESLLQNEIARLNTVISTLESEAITLTSQIKEKEEFLDSTTKFETYLEIRDIATLLTAHYNHLSRLKQTGSKGLCADVSEILNRLDILRDKFN